MPFKSPSLRSCWIWSSPLELLSLTEVRFPTRRLFRLMAGTGALFRIVGVDHNVLAEATNNGEGKIVSGASGASGGKGTGRSGSRYNRGKWQQCPLAKKGLTSTRF
jgi:hypothetical protein